MNKVKKLKIVVAPQAFKNCASAGQVARAIWCGIKRSLPKAHVVNVPIADGGDGTLPILLDAQNGSKHKSKVQNAFGKTVLVDWGVVKNTAIIESALVCGMATVPKDELNPLAASTYGVGELIKKALSKGYRKIFVGLGGSATNDAGTGLAKALGVRFLDAKGNELPHGGAALADLAYIDTSRIDKRLKSAEIIVGCDVTTPLLGPKGATRVYARQKGATPQMIDQLEKAMTHYAAIVLREMGINISKLPRGGAAGGMASALHLFCNGQLVSGAEWILNKIGFNRLVKNADLVIISEGRMDWQTGEEKGPLVVAKIAKEQNIPVIAIVGTTGEGCQRLKKYGVKAVFPASPPDSGIPDNSLFLLEQAAEKAILSF